MLTLGEGNVTLQPKQLGGSSPKILGALPRQPFHHRVHFLRSPKPKKIRTSYRLTFEIYH